MVGNWVHIGQVLREVLASDVQPLHRPHYAPPYDSPIEEAFAWHILKYLDESAAFIPQYEVVTICGRFRLDFVASVGGRRVGFECDGAEYHDEARDELRDALILFDAGAVDAIYRLRGTDLHWRMEDLLYLLMRYEPSIFSSRAIGQLPRLASSSVLRYPDDADPRGVLLGYGRGEDRRLGVYEFLHMQRRAVEKDPRLFRFEKKFVAFAQAHAGRSLDNVIALWHERLMAGVA